MKVGAAWIKVSKDGKTKYLSCNMELEGKKYYFSLMKNSHKTEEKHPDYNILVRDADSAPGRVVEQFNGKIVDDGEIPF